VTSKGSRRGPSVIVVDVNVILLISGERALACERVFERARAISPEGFAP
jgi:hypothetical protein